MRGAVVAGQPLPSRDGLIAATALELRLTVVARNVVDFARSGVGTIDRFG